MQKLRKKALAKALTRAVARGTLQKHKIVGEEARSANGKDPCSCPPTTVKCHPNEAAAADRGMSPAGSCPEYEINTASGLQKGKEASGDLKAASFIQWAQSQSSSKQVSIDDYIVQHCKEDLGTQDSLGVEDILAAAAAGGVLVPSVSCRPASDTKQQLMVEPFLPHDGHVKGAPKPQCHKDRVAAADGINALRATRDGEIGEHHRQHSAP